MIGSLTAYFEKGTSLPILQTSKEELLFSIRTSMASGRYESSSVKKVIYVEELYNSPIKANAVIEWKPESAERNYSTLIAIVLGSFFAVITGVLLFVLVRRRKEKSQTYRVNQLQRAEDDSVSTLSQPEPHVEVSCLPYLLGGKVHILMYSNHFVSITIIKDVWQKALNTWNAPYHQQQQQQHKQLVEPTSTAKQHNKFGAVASTQNTQEGYSNTAVFTEEDTPEAALSKTIGSLENNLQIEDDNVGIEQELDTEEDEDDHVSFVDDRDEEDSLPGEVEGIEQSLERNGHQDEESFNTSSDNEDQSNSVLEDSVHDQLLETEVGQDSYPDDETTPSPDDETESTCQIDPKGEYDNTQLNEDEINELTDDSKKNVSSEKN